VTAAEVHELWKNVGADEGVLTSRVVDYIADTLSSATNGHELMVKFGLDGITRIPRLFEESLSRAEALEYTRKVFDLYLRYR